MVPIELVDGPCRDRRLRQRLDDVRVVTVPALLQSPGECIPRVGELIERQFEQLVDIFLEVFHDLSMCLLWLHSHRNATSGSTRAARLAGIRHATNATSDSVIETNTNVVTSVGVTPNNRLVISRVNRYAPTSPSATPTNVSRINSRNTSRSTSVALAPNAILIPIS